MMHAPAEDFQEDFAGSSFRAEAVPFEVNATHEGVSSVVRFGAFAGWWGDIRGDKLPPRKFWDRLIDNGFRHFAHVSDGYNVRSQHFLAIPLTVNREFESFAGELCSRYWFSLSDFSREEYVKALAQFDIESADLDPLEALYPVALSGHNLERIGANSSIENMIKSVRHRKSRNAAKIFILADNCD
ncbi:MAG: hypothetical protein AAFW97_09820 [Pseudomonadota bacterium]